ncbi:MAG: MBL fold metallo-hydrolase [Actinobacteria bacterium]|nr:MBL fold metallo-hydrolase [Actinomycetota bacterium]
MDIPYSEKMEAIALEPIDALTVTTLVDNVTDSLLSDQGPAKRPSMTAAPRMAARFLVGGETDDTLRAEHGFSALVTVEKAGRETRVLFDAGRTPDGLVENMRRLDLPPDQIDIVVLSHGHWDHVTGMDGLVRRLGSASMPVLSIRSSGHAVAWRSPAATPWSCLRRVSARCREPGSRSSSSDSPPLCSTARCW